MVQKYKGKVQKTALFPGGPTGFILAKVAFAECDPRCLRCWPLGREKEDLCLRTCGRTGMMMMMMVIMILVMTMIITMVIIDHDDADN